MGVYFTPDALMNTARERTGLRDFGDDWFMTPFKALLAFVNSEAGLPDADAGPVERIIAALSDRLRLVQRLKDQPEILEEEITVAGAIIGLPRTGSTMMHRLLASSPQLTAPFWWETTFPLPLDGERPGDPTPRRELAKQVVERLLREWPDFESIDPIEATAVAEEIILLDKTFLSTTWDSMMHVPSYGFWQAEQDHTPAYRELRVWLQVLQNQSPWRRGRKWILKTPHHLLGGMSGLLAVFPEAKLLMTHRDPADVLPSYCSMCASLTANTSATYRRETQGAYWTKRFVDGLKRFETVRAALPAGAVVDIDYRQTVNDPIAAGRMALEAMGLAFGADDEMAMRACIDANARDKRPRHRYSAEEFGLTPEGVVADFAFYKGSNAA